MNTIPVFATNEWIDVPEQFIPTLLERNVIHFCDWGHEEAIYEVNGADDNEEYENLKIIDSLIHTDECPEGPHEHSGATFK